jgi:hypothetical protein
MSSDADEAELPLAMRLLVKFVRKQKAARKRVKEGEGEGEWKRLT